MRNNHLCCRREANQFSYNRAASIVRVRAVVVLCFASWCVLFAGTIAGFASQPPAVRSFRSALTTATISTTFDTNTNHNKNNNGLTTTIRQAGSTLRFSSSDDDPNNGDDSARSQKGPLRLVMTDPRRSILFSALMTACGAGLGPFLDSYHSAFGVLQYDDPIKLTLWGSEAYPALTTAWWVPELFGLAGFLIGWLYVLLDDSLLEPSDQRRWPYPPKILAGISFFTLQYWLSGVLVQANLLDRTGILNLMSLLAAVGFVVLDGTFSGLIVSVATCLGGPLIEAGLITATTSGLLGSGGYHYTDLGETGFFPLWIIPVYFLGGPANGNLARGFWNALSLTGNNKNKKENGATSASTENRTSVDKISCTDCGGTRRVACPNCDGVGTYVAMGNRTVKCTSCNGRGFVMCRSCFNLYDEDPYDIESIREVMNRMPD